MAAQHHANLWWQGKQWRWEDATVHVTDLAWSAVGAVFEGIRGYKNEETQQVSVFRLREHMERLQESSRLVRLPLSVTTDELIDLSLDLIRANELTEDFYLRPLVYSKPTANRFNPAELEGELLVTTNTMPSHLLTGFSQHAKVSSWTRISDNVMPPRVKNISNYRNGQLATHEVRGDGYNVALMLNAQGKVAEAPGACVFFVRKGKVITPDVTSGILESITRDALIHMLREQLDVEVIERPVDRTELYVADEVFTCGTAAEVTPIVSVDKFQVGNGEPGPITTKLEQLYHDVIRGVSDLYPEWRTAVYPALAATS